MAKTRDTATPAPAAVLLDRARQDRLAALDRPGLNALVRDLRARRDVLAGADDVQRRPVAEALRRAVEEKRSRQDRAGDEPATGADSGQAREDRPGRKGGTAPKVFSDPASETGAETDQPAAAPTTSPASSGAPVKSGRAEREARRLANEAERAARREARRTGIPPMADPPAGDVKPAVRKGKGGKGKAGKSGKSRRGADG